MSDEINIDLKDLKPDEDQVFDSKIIDEVENNKVEIPAFASAAWSDYVISLLEDEELQNGSPTRNGLSRVAKLIFGENIVSTIISYHPPQQENYATATVHCRLEVFVSNDRYVPSLTSSTLCQDGIAEVNSRNTPAPFHMHCSASAYSKAEAQALRKLLCLNCVSADEVTPEEMVIEGDAYMPDTLIRDDQINVIDRICKRANISVLDLINSGENKYIFIEQISQSKGQSIIKYISQIQSGKIESPVKNKYDPNWRAVNQKNKGE